MSGTQKIFRKYLEHPHFKLFLCGTEMNLPHIEVFFKFSGYLGT